MNTIDHVILIPRQPHIIWNFLSDIGNNARWQENCSGIAFLSTQRSGNGTRWRHTTNSGREFVIEVTAWYDRIGYEYTMIDGAPYRQHRGRIRLQEIAEGTLVEWIFQYELGGVLAGVRNSLMTRRRIRKNITESLRNLHDYVLEQTGGGKEYKDAKSLMRDAPDVEKRSHYQPRHAAEKGVEEIVEPPITDDDTQPRPSIMHAEKIELEEAEKPAVQVDEVVEPIAVVEAPEVIEIPEDVVEDVEVAAVATEPEPVIEPEAEQETAVPEPQQPEIEPQIATRELNRVELDQVDEEEALSAVDTGTVSVFELFGLAKPSETQEMRAVETFQQLTLFPMDKLTPSEYGRVGLRWRKRRKSVRLRRPGK